METPPALHALLGNALRANEPLSRHTTLKVGGPAALFWEARQVETLVRTLDICVRAAVPYLFIGHGSNLLMSDAGYAGLVIQNKCKGVKIDGPCVHAESGVSFGSLFLHTARAGLSGLEWAIGIPGTVGGALVSNAGAYRGNIGPLVQSVRVWTGGRDTTVGAEWMEFSYRDSRLRRAGVGPDVVLSCELTLPEQGDPAEIGERAKRFQAERRQKQPFAPSAGSFFKNVVNAELAQVLPGLSAGMRGAGVVPAGFLIEACGLKGAAHGGAQISPVHANFLVNAGGATASDIRALAQTAKRAVFDRFGVALEEEVLYVGEWEEEAPLPAS